MGAELKFWIEEIFDGKFVLEMVFSSANFLIVTVVSLGVKKLDFITKNVYK